MPKTLLCPPEILNLDLWGRTYIVTGGNSGIGLVTVKQLAKQGAQVVLACRRIDEGERRAQELKSLGLRGEIVVSQLDLSDLSSVRSFAKSSWKTIQPFMGSSTMLA